MLDRLTAGEVALRPHTALYDAQQNLRYEECLTRRGFDGPYTILYHEHRPHELLPAECKHGWSDVWSDEAALQPALLARHHYCSRALPRPTTALAPIDARVPLLRRERSPARARRGLGDARRADVRVPRALGDRGTRGAR